MILPCVLFAVMFATQVLGGNILSPPYRNVVGPATKQACGSSVTTYLSKNPTAGVLAIDAAEGAGYNAAECNIGVCAGYQFSDAPASRIVYLTTADPLNITVNYTIPASPISSADWYDLYAHTLTLTTASNGAPIWSVLDVAECGTGSSACVDPGKAQTATFTHPSVDQLDAIGLGDVPTGSCSAPGDCYISWSLVDYYRQEPYTYSSRLLEAGCVDVVIDWSTSTRK